ncbi:MAG: Uncharacterised protein [Halieaceae bacterium]|nr:MAG: Uncharacterised protein [Halieaceae bacterium]
MTHMVDAQLPLQPLLGAAQWAGHNTCIEDGEIDLGVIISKGFTKAVYAR